MNRLQTVLAACAAVLPLLSMPAFAHDGVHINNAYARVMGKIGASGAVFFEIENHQDVDDRLINAASEVAAKVELHTHKEEGGIMKMMHVPEGFVVPALGFYTLARGGDHVMLMGLTSELKDGDTIDLTLTFERAGEVQVQVTVDNNRKAVMGHDMSGHHAGGAHGAHGAQ